MLFLFQISRLCSVMLSFALLRYHLLCFIIISHFIDHLLCYNLSFQLSYHLSFALLASDQSVCHIYMLLSNIHYHSTTIHIQIDMSVYCLEYSFSKLFKRCKLKHPGALKFWLNVWLAFDKDFDKDVWNLLVWEKG